MPTADGLDLAPFRGWTFDPARVHLDDVLCPPYDVVEPADEPALRERSPANVVHVVRPPGRPPARYEAAARTMRGWIEDATLRRDEVASLYVYEHAAGDVRQRGVIGAVRLRDPADRVVVPHEGVFPGPVADRLALMVATDAQLEPILLTSEGVDRLAGLLATVVSEPPALAAEASGSEHRLWRLTDPERVHAVVAAVASAPALVADGHHRYATYRELQATRHAQGRGAGPWDHGLALVVGTDPATLTLGAIHRTVRGVALPVPGPRTSPSGVRIEVGERLPVQGSASAPPGSPDVVVATDGRDRVEIRLVVAPGASARERLVSALLADVLLPELYALGDGHRRVEYHHDAARAVGSAQRGGVALLVRAPELADVRALAAAGVMMPRKSTSFGPKPQSGLVLRTLDGPGA